MLMVAIGARTWLDRNSSSAGSPSTSYYSGRAVAVTRAGDTVLGPRGTAAGEEPSAESPRRLAWRRLKRDRLALASGVFLACLLFMCFPGAKLYERAVGHGPNDLFPYAVSVAGQKPVGPFTRVYSAPQTADDDPFQLKHTPPRDKAKTLLLLGADGPLGRDEFLRVLYGGRVSLTIAIGAAAIAILIGIAFGSVAGYFGGWVDAGISRFTDLMMAFPVLLFLVVLGSALSSDWRDVTSAASSTRAWCSSCC